MERLSLPGRFTRQTSGNTTVEFVLAVPLMFMILMMAIELGVYSVRYTYFERGLDMAVRDIRLGTGDGITHDTIKDRICDIAGLPNCESALRLEMVPTTVRGFSELRSAADCVNAAEPVTPVRRFIHGSDNTLMVLRACYMFRPFFPTTGIGRSVSESETGIARMTALSAFVQEPSE